MATPQPARPQQGTGLPPGVEVAPLGSRFVAYLIDALVPAVLGALLGLVVPGMSGAAQTVLSVILVLLVVAWTVLVWRGIALVAASPGLRVMKLQVVGFYNGRPIGWGRAFLRGVLLWLLSLTGIGLLLLVGLLLVHPRKQGWHDLTAKAVVIKARPLAPAPRPSAAVSAGAQRPLGPSRSAGLSPPSARPGPAMGVPPAPGASGPRGAHAIQHPAPTPPAPGVQNDAQSHGVEPGPSDWVAELDDGREIDVAGLVLLGRNPQPQPGEEDARLVKLADETRTVSKSHLAIGLDAEGIYVVDQGSTNGSTVTGPEGDPQRALPGEVVRVADDSIVSLGDHWLRIRHRRD